MSRRLQSDILQSRSSLRLLQGYFVHVPVRRVLVGYFVENTPSAVYGGTFALPLYDRFDHIHLTFGDRWVLSETPVDKRAAAQSELAQRLLQKIEVVDAGLVAQGAPQEFASALKSKSLGNPWVRRACAFTQIVLGNANEALVHLTQLETMTSIAHYPHFLADVTLVSKLLREDLEAARAQLHSWEIAARRHLGVDGELG